MKTLIVDDDFAARKLLTAYLREYGTCDQVVDGEEAIQAVKMALKEKAPYDLICLDIMMPNKDGQEVLQEIRSIENRRGIYGLSGVKIIMVTALDDHRNIMDAFTSQCEAYITKPIEKEELISRLRFLQLLPGEVR
jgi:two-component system chemotaxis response regulator CheY